MMQASGDVAEDIYLDLLQSLYVVPTPSVTSPSDAPLATVQLPETAPSLLQAPLLSTTATHSDTSVSATPSGPLSLTPAAAAHISLPSEAEDQEEPEVDFTCLLAAKSHMISIDNAKSRSLAELVAEFAQVPGDDTLLFGYRPGHAPVDGRCNFCNRALDDIIAFKDTDSSQLRRIRIEAHVNVCGATAAKAEFESTFAINFPASHPVLPHNGKTPLSSDKPNHPKDWATHPYTISQQILSSFQDSARAMSCHLCPTGSRPDFVNTDSWRGHLGQKHQFIMTPTQRGVPARVAALSQDWNPITARVYETTPPIFWIEEGRYIVNPGEQEDVAERILATRLAKTVTRPVGRRPDLSYPPDVIHLVADEPMDKPWDDSYVLVSRRNGRIRDFICIICCHNPDLSFTTRANPWSHNGSSHIYHQERCMAATVRALTRLEDLKACGIESPIDRHYIYKNGVLHCPGCSRTFDQKFKFCNHLILCHGYRVKGPVIGQQMPSAAAFIFKDEKDVETWAGAVHNTYERGKKGGRPVIKKDKAGSSKPNKIADDSASASSSTTTTTNSGVVSKDSKGKKRANSPGVPQAESTKIKKKGKKNQ